MSKKTADQLDREIAEVLAGRSPSEAVRIAQVAQDKRNKKEKAIDGLRNDPSDPGEMKRSPSKFIDWLLQSYGPGRKAKDSRFDSMPMTRSEAQRAMKVLRTSPGFSTFYGDDLDGKKVRDLVLSFRRKITSTGRAHSTKSKKLPSQARVVSRHGLGTADVRTGEGAYWIVTGPTGYRVDYKPWGPSNEVDLGTFPSRKQARAKITTHAGSIGATIVS
jgi:hypothetical protein